MEVVTESLHDIVLAAQAAASNTDADSSVIDMSGFSCALFLVAITDSANTGKAEIRVEGSDSSTSGFKRLDIEEVSAVASANDGLNGKILRVEVKKPLQRYLRLNLLSTVANIAFGETHALRYGARAVPPRGDDDVLAEIVVAGPAYA